MDCALASYLTTLCPFVILKLTGSGMNGIFHVYSFSGHKQKKQLSHCHGKRDKVTSSLVSQCWFSAIAALTAIIICNQFIEIKQRSTVYGIWIHTASASAVRGRSYKRIMIMRMRALNVCTDGKGSSSI